MPAAAYSIHKQPHASELYSCKHENVSVYKSAHLSIMDHIRHTQGQENMNLNGNKSLPDARITVLDVYLNEDWTKIIIETVDGVQHPYFVRNGNRLGDLTTAYEGLRDALESGDSASWSEAKKELLIDVEF